MGALSVFTLSGPNNASSLEIYLKEIVQMPKAQQLTSQILFENSQKSRSNLTRKRSKEISCTPDERNLKGKKKKKTNVFRLKATGDVFSLF